MAYAFSVWDVFKYEYFYYEEIEWTEGKNRSNGETKQTS
jgi:hypothetical protein